jgi:hypothetical protein
MSGFIENIIATPWKYSIFSSVIFCLLLLIIYAWNPFKISTNHPVIASLFLICVLYMLVIGYLISSAKGNVNYRDITENFGRNIGIAGSILGGVLVSILIIFIIIWLVRWLPGLTVIFNFIFYLIIIIGILGIIYLIFKPTFDRIFSRPQERELAFSLVSKLILYFPCTVINFIDYLKEQWKITTKPIWILLFLEIVLIALKFIVPYVFQYLISHDGTHLLDNPIYLNKAKTLGTFENLHQTDNNSDPKFKYHYAISAWFYINPQPPNTRPAYTRYTNILNYGDKPRVEFNSLKNSFRVQVKTSEDNVVTLYTKEGIPMQAWNNIVINYAGGNMDLFFNGELVASKPNIAPYMKYENVVVGAENGIEGGICNVVYYKKTLTKGDITMGYKLLKNKSPPVI